MCVTNRRLCFQAIENHRVSEMNLKHGLCFRDEPETASEMNLKHGLCEAYVGYPNDGYESNYMYGDVYAYMLIPTLMTSSNERPMKSLMMRSANEQYEIA